MTIVVQRWVVVLGALAILVTLAGWLAHRRTLAAACEAASGVWDGRTSTCRPARPGPILQRDLYRT